MVGMTEISMGRKEAGADGVEREGGGRNDTVPTYTLMGLWHLTRPVWLD